MNNQDYFQGCHTVEAIKKAYRSWAFKLHPDHGGNDADMKELNRQYEIALQGCDRQKSYDEQGEEHTYYYNEDIERGLMDKIAELLSLKMEGVDIFLIGTWLWIIGDSKPYKSELKNLGCMWHSKRGCWYWRGVTSKAWANSPHSLGDLAKKYGVQNCKNFTNDETQKTSKAKKVIRH
jgi:hypothetical protein